MNDFEDKIRSILISFAVNNCTAEAAKTAIEEIMQLMKPKGNATHAKALRKKGTDKWYTTPIMDAFGDSEWFEDELAEIYSEESRIEDIIEAWQFDKPLPSDAELINIKIIVE